MQGILYLLHIVLLLYSNFPSNSFSKVFLGTVVQTDKDFWALSSQNNYNPWIIDSDAFEKMISCSHMLNSFYSSSGSENVRIVEW